MKTRYKFAKDPMIYTASGMHLEDDFTPTVMALRTFFNGVLDELFVVKNPASKHICTDICMQKIQVIIGSLENGITRKSVPRKVLQKVKKDKSSYISITHKSSTFTLIRDFEELLEAYQGVNAFQNGHDAAVIHAIGVTFQPCATDLIINEANIYLA